MACCLIKHLELLVNHDLALLRFFIIGRGENIRRFYIDYLEYRNHNPLTVITSDDIRHMSNIPFGEGALGRGWEVFLSLCYSPYSSNNIYKEWDIRTATGLLEEYIPEINNFPMSTLLNLIIFGSERSMKNLNTRAWSSQIGEIGVLRKVDKFWLNILEVLPNLLDNLLNILDRF